MSTFDLFEYGVLYIDDGVIMYWKIVLVCDMRSTKFDNRNIDIDMVFPLFFEVVHYNILIWKMSVLCVVCVIILWCSLTTILDIIDNIDTIDVGVPYFPIFNTLWWRFECDEDNNDFGGSNNNNTKCKMYEEGVKNSYSSLE